MAYIGYKRTISGTVASGSKEIKSGAGDDRPTAYTITKGINEAAVEGYENDAKGIRWYKISGSENTTGIEIEGFIKANLIDLKFNTYGFKENKEHVQVYNKEDMDRIITNIIVDKKNGVTSIHVVATGYIGSNKTGKLIVKLPQGFVGTMIKFTVEILEKYGNTFAEYDILGQIYAGGDGNWASISTSACRGIGNNIELPVSFGEEEDRAAIAIGNDNTSWGSYSAVKIKDVTAYFTHFSAAEWASGWEISAGVPTGTYTRTVQTTMLSEKTIQMFVDAGYPIT